MERSTWKTLIWFICFKLWHHKYTSNIKCMQKVKQCIVSFFLVYSTPSIGKTSPYPQDLDPVMVNSYNTDMLRDLKSGSTYAQIPLTQALSIYTESLAK